MLPALLHPKWQNQRCGPLFVADPPPVPCALRLTLPPRSTGISGKTQILFSIVYITRYLDVFFNFVSVYNTVRYPAGCCSGA